MNKQRLIKITMALAAMVIIALLIKDYMLTHRPAEEETQGFTRKRGGPCPGETKVFTMNDPYMRKVIEEGQRFKVIMNYYDCNPVKKGDLVFYQMHKSVDPVVKIVRGVPGDKFTLSKDEKYKAWNLKVNGDIVRSEVDHIPYFFGGPMPPPLALYQKAHKGIIQNGDVLLLSSWPPGDIDSGQFGMFSMQDVVGKVELIDQPAQ